MLLLASVLMEHFLCGRKLWKVFDKYAVSLEFLLIKIFKFETNRNNLVSS